LRSGYRIETTYYFDRLTEPQRRAIEARLGLPAEILAPEVKPTVTVEEWRASKIARLRFAVAAIIIGCVTGHRDESWGAPLPGGFEPAPDDVKAYVARAQRLREELEEMLSRMKFNRPTVIERRGLRLVVDNIRLEARP
jgi:hypothetical protein